MSTATQQPETSLIKVEEISITMQNAGGILTANENLLSKCVNAGNAFIDTIEGSSMTDDLDAALNDWQVKAKQALSIMNTRRSPVTQLMDQIKSAFTAIEGKIDPKKADSVYSKIQNIRNDYAKKKADDAKAKEQQILKDQAISKEKIDAKAKAESQIRESYQNKLLEFKTFYTNKLNNATLETLDAVVNAIKELKLLYPRDKFNELSVSISPVYLTKEDLAPIIFDTRAALYDELSANFRENMEEHQRHLLNLVASKKGELETIAKADASKKAELEAAAKKRQEDDELRLRQQAESAKQQDQQKVSLQQNIANTNNLFDSAAQLAEVKSDTGTARQSYKITVLSPAGLGAIFLFWFEKEGQFLNIEDAMKKTGNQMKAFCEKHANKTSEKIDHEHVIYEDDYKAIATNKAA
ncbi:hypothetical protein J3L18_00165 [Mucilaginibacter gossypii]|uniref:hypothetical protein n=1 Tax=Mucilaginibacter gossypii TaxID=551996 RepID=UPI000DCCC5E6|nr:MULTISPECIES: hypothetical protein [Mucilaginibacter]QTE37517.1 hypothetical protein J3L18_00165 [Mucilaginibacter gossypii]RAV52343.1 hypothetical protein DIU36_24725 [Mucilaginibacter rubeus]